MTNKLNNIATKMEYALTIEICVYNSVFDVVQFIYISQYSNYLLVCACVDEPKKSKYKLMKVVEVIKTDQTDPAVLEKGLKWVEEIGKVSVLCDDTPVRFLFYVYTNIVYMYVCMYIY